MDEDHSQDPAGTFDDSSRRSGEGVRIIGADEAAAAIEAGQVAGRRPEDAPRFGDVPEAPSGPRPPLRFPYPGNDPAAVPRPPVVPPETPPPGPPPPSATDSGRIPLPHWTEPPSGEVPRILADAGPPSSDDDLDAWTSLSSGPRWRDQHTDWAEADFDDAILGDQETRVGALDTRPPEDDDEPLFVEEPVAPARTTTRLRRPPTEEAGDFGRARSGRGERELQTRVVTGLVFAALVLGAAALGPAALLVVSGAVIVMAAAELYHVLRSRAFQPATLLGLVGTASLLGAAYWRGEVAVPLVLALFVVFGLLWYLAGVVRARPAVNLAVTVMAFLYVGFLGSFVALMLRAPARHGVAFLLGAVLATAAYDVGAFMFGRWMGRTPLAPDVSPNKTLEGTLGASLVTLVVCLALVRMIHPWTFMRSFWLAVVVVVAAPLGDLCESMIKRDLAVKDMGSMLPGHGGILDRVDALLFVVPAVYYLVRLLKIA